MANENELLSVYRGLRPMIIEDIDEKSKFNIRAKKLEVAEAYTTGSSTMVVCEAFGKPMTVPCEPSLPSMSIGAGVIGVWFFCDYSTLRVLYPGSAVTYLSGKANKLAITERNEASPALGTLVNNAEYRCNNISPTTAPSMTIATIANAATEFTCAVVFTAPNTAAPVITNNGGYTLKYVGQDVISGVWTPVPGTRYRMSITFDGIYVMIYISGVA